MLKSVTRFIPRSLLIVPLIFGLTSKVAFAEEPAPKHKVLIVLVGDSTTAEKSGWGPGFRDHLNDRATCTNTAAGGRSSMSFMKEGKWTNALALKGDYYLIQFGHNNQPGKEGRSTDMPTFVSDMKKYVTDTKAIGAKPVLITPLVRRHWEKPDYKKINSTLQPYADEVKKIAEEYKVPLIDLHARSIEVCEKLGRDACNSFSPIKTDNGRNAIDGTHLNEQGSALFGKVVAQELAKAVPKLAPCLESLK